jgi:hypothetical protein
VIDLIHTRWLLAEVEARGVVLYWSERANALMCDSAADLPDTVLELVRRHVGPLSALVVREGCRVGFLYGHRRWHIAVRRRDWLEFLCGHYPGGTPTPIATLPAFEAGGELCQRCIRAQVRRELGRVPLSSRQEWRV